ncbi:hypothetical protein SLEP1_g59088 [Rubroshorea leprosula]|uniref:BED-type domain-containing protein n=1 Tax=Rubroshorea leprosula TaxID=152421 RepID=A0AAV5MRE5_9ROSI|nr:hypothetical protein SLEP1_g59088 [Rubroshorea leprosula]
MSSEETVSVGGSEEVRALEYGDVSMTSESFDSERTKEGVGRSEVVGVEGDRVPITVVEVEGRRERCYDVDADIVPEVKQYESELGTRDSLGYLVESYEISSRVLIRPVGVKEGAYSAPRDHWMPVYAHYLAAGLSLHSSVFQALTRQLHVLKSYRRSHQLRLLLPFSFDSDKLQYSLQHQILSKAFKMKRKRSDGDGQFEKLSVIAQSESESDSDPFIVDVDKGKDKEYASNIGSCSVLGKEVVEFEVQAKSKARGAIERASTSAVWEHFILISASENKDGVRKGKCKYCGKEYICTGTHGTSNMRRHAPKCPRRVQKDPLQMMLNNSGKLVKKIDQETFKELCAMVVIKHAYPFTWVEHEAVRELMKYLNPEVKPICRNTVKNHCLKIYKREKERIKESLKKLSSRICLTCDMWTSAKSKTSTKEAGEGGAGKELVPSTSAGVEEVVPRLELKRKGNEKVGTLQRKKKVVEEEVRGSKVLQFVPRPPSVELDPELKESEAEGAKARAPGKGKGLVPPLSFQSSLFEAKNVKGARRFINATFPEVDKCQAKDEALRYCKATVVKHALEEFMESVKDRSLLQRQRYQLQKEKEELEKKNKDMQKALDEVREAYEKEIKAMKEAVVELKKNVQLLVHNRMEEHISNFVNSSSFDNIVNLYRLPTAIIAFTDCRKKVKAEYPEVDIMKITFGKQEQGVEENGRTIFPPNFDFEFVAMEEEEAEVEETEVGAGGAEVDES